MSLGITIWALPVPNHPSMIRTCPSGTPAFVIRFPRATVCSGITQTSGWRKEKIRTVLSQLVCILLIFIDVTLPPWAGAGLPCCSYAHCELGWAAIHPGSYGQKRHNQRCYPFILSLTSIMSICDNRLPFPNHNSLSFSYRFLSFWVRLPDQSPPSHLHNIFKMRLGDSRR